MFHVVTGIVQRAKLCQVVLSSSSCVHSYMRTLSALSMLGAVGVLLVHKINNSAVHQAVSSKRETV